jgi:hypothetical protein
MCIYLAISIGGHQLRDFEHHFDDELLRIGFTFIFKSDAHISEARVHFLRIYSRILIHHPEHEDGLNDRPARKSTLRASPLPRIRTKLV